MHEEHPCVHAESEESFCMHSKYREATCYPSEWQKEICQQPGNNGGRRSSQPPEDDLFPPRTGVTSKHLQLEFEAVCAVPTEDARNPSGEVMLYGAMRILGPEEN